MRRRAAGADRGQSVGHGLLFGDGRTACIVGHGVGDSENLATEESGVEQALDDHEDKAEGDEPKSL